MEQDALVASLYERVRTLEDIIGGLDARAQRATALAVSTQAQVEQNTARLRDMARLAEIVTHDEAAQVPGPRHAAPPRDRHGLRVIPGGLAAFAPAAFLLHDGIGAACLTAWRWIWAAKHDHVRWAASAILLGAAGAWGVPAAAQYASAGPVPHPRAVVPYHRPRHHRPDWPSKLPVPPAVVHRADRDRRHDGSEGAVQGPVPSPVNLAPAPLPSPSILPTPTPSGTVTGLVGQVKVIMIGHDLGHAWSGISGHTGGALW